MDPQIFGILAIGFAVICAVSLGALMLLGNPKTASDNSGPSESTTVHRNQSVRSLTKPHASENAQAKLRERLVHAGLYKTKSSYLFYVTQVMFAVIPIVLGMGAHAIGVVPLRTALAFGLITGIAGVVAPGLWLDYRKSKRQTSIRRALPDALDVITICVEAGLSLNAAIVRVSKDLNATHPMLATELTIVHRQIQMGKTTGAGLQSLAERFDLEELRSLASVVHQSERFGASIANALRVHGDSLRVRRMQQAQVKAQKAAVKILIPTLLCIFPALFVVVLGPATYDIIEMLGKHAN